MVPDIQAYPSPNFGPRQDGAQPNMIVLHYTAMADTQAVLRWLADPAREVSAHYVISPQGQIWQQVQETERAWHAGASAWGATVDVNSASIGIEIVNTGFTPFAEPQMRSVEDLVADIRSRWAIPPERVVGHSCIAPGRKSDPGARFDWRRLAQRNLAVWSDIAANGDGDIADLIPQLRQLGYTAQVDDQTLFEAFRLRHCPWLSGPVTATDVARAKDLAARFPVDAVGLVA